MRILLINSVCRNGSTGKIAYDLYTQSRQDGHEAAICYGRGPLVEGENIFRFGLDWETYLHAGLTRITGWTGCFSAVSTRRLLKFMDTFQPDVIHLHEPHAYFVNLRPLFRYIKKKNIPLVYTCHCEFAYTGKCGYAYECENWKTGCGNCPKLREYPKTLWFDHTAAMLRQKQELLNAIKRLRIAVPSQWLADRVKQSVLKNRDICVVCNGIDTQNVFHPQESDHLREKHGLKDEKIVLAVAPGLMSQRKGGHWVVQLAEKFCGENVKFILIGVDDISKTFPPNVIAMGRTSNQLELAQYYSLADCFLICSEKETFSMTCAESLCCGTPVAGFCAGAPETVFMPPHALFAPYGDLETLEKYVKTQLSAGFDRAELAKNMEKLYSRENMYRGYMAAYEEMVGEVTK